MSVAIHLSFEKDPQSECECDGIYPISHSHSIFGYRIPEVSTPKDRNIDVSVLSNLLEKVSFENMKELKFDITILNHCSIKSDH
jgi:hypothetical protein